jgi:hypothetical protein
MTKTLTITAATILAIIVAATATLFTLSAVAHSDQTCGRVDTAQLREAADPHYAATLEKLARCGN